MILPVSLSMTGDQHERLIKHLFPSDGKEAVAVALCGRRDGERRHRLMVQDILYVPYDSCARSAVEVTWPTDAIVPLLEKATDRELSVVKLHSHPTGFPAFSQTDTDGDLELLPMIRNWVDADIPHCSVIMLPDGQMFGRALISKGRFVPMESINVVGDDLHFWYPKNGESAAGDFTASHAQLFGQGTTERLRRLSVGVVGCSGTGSPVIEQLMRLGIGELVLVDDDRMEERNVNRIINSTMDDAREGRFKVDVLSRAIEQTGLGTRVVPIAKNLWDKEAIYAVGQCDILFGCLDSIDGRYLLNSIATFYTQPYFDIGIRLDAVPSGAQRGRIREVCGSVHYLQPGRSSLISRGLISFEQIAAAGLRRNDPAAYKLQAGEGYISGVTERHPAVISVNVFAASLAVNEMLARIHPYREEANSFYAQDEFSLASMELLAESESTPCPVLKSKVGVGDCSPLLGLPELTVRSAA